MSSPPRCQTSIPEDFKPLNREPSPKDFLFSNLTTVSHSYDRNHGPIAHLDGSSHRITFSSTISIPSLFPSSDSLCLSLSDLQTLFQPASVTSALQCAGNRRHTMRTKLKEVNGIDWADGAVMNAKWTGARLCDVLSHFLGTDITEVQPAQVQNCHLAFACHAVPVQDDSWYGSSIPLARAFDPTSDILLAYAQNGAELTPAHGYPVRVVIPGIAGARSVKWLDSVTIQDHESTNFYQQRDYKILPPQAEDAESAKDWWERTSALMDMPVNSVVFALGKDRDRGSGSDGGHEDGDSIDQHGDGTVSRDADGMIEVRGYALPGGDGGPVTTVEIRIDQGDWVQAELLFPDDHKDIGGETNCNDYTGGHGRKEKILANGSTTSNSSSNNKWSWALFRWRGAVQPGKHTIWSRATDHAGNRQESERSEWNFRGVAYNGYGEAEVDVL